MVVLIVVIAACGFLAAGMLKGWFGTGSGEGSAGSGGSPVISTDVTGVANLERSGVGYTLEKDVAVKSGDIVETKSDSEAGFTIAGNNRLDMAEKAELEITGCKPDNVQMTLNSGEIYAEMNEAPEEFKIVFGKSSMTAEEAIFSISRQSGSADLNVYAGKVSYEAAGKKGELSSGSKLQLSTSSDNAETADILKLDAAQINDFLLGKLQKTDGKICFSRKALNAVAAERKAEKEKAAKALEQEAIAVAEGEGNAAEQSADALTCTIRIQCKSILKNMDDLKSGKDRYVPSSGVILSTSKIEFQKGDTAYDVTKRACSATGIQIEASYSPGYGSYYVEGINHLYEFDCGELSGWMYQVNGWAPNYGCSEYTLKDGDSIVWYYTCTGR